MRFKIDCAILIVGSKFTILNLFYFVFEGNFPSTSSGGAYIWRGLSTEGNLRFKIDCAILIFGSKFAILALFYFVFEGNFPSTSPRGGRFNGGFFALPVWGAYIWRGLYMEGLIFGILQYFIASVTTGVDCKPTFRADTFEKGRK